MRLGTAVHCLALTPRRFGHEVVVSEFERRSNAGKAAFAALVASGKTPLKPAELSRARAIVNALHASPAARYLLRRGRPERAVIRQRAGGLLPLRGRLDLHDNRARTVIELKTCRSLEAIASSIRQYGYLLSAAFYAHLVRARAIIFIFVESVPPHRVRVVSLDSAQLQEGRDQWQSALARFDQCWASGVWPEAEPSAPDLDDDPLLLQFMPAVNSSTRRFEMPVGELEL